MRPITGINRHVVVNRRRHELILYGRKPGRSKLEARVRYPIAVGMMGHRTPSGLYLVRGKSNHPAWQMPDSDWVREAGLVPGTILGPNDPANPIKARWIGIWDGVGIHGTSEDWSIGRDESHGCIRMHVEDVKKLYPQVPRNTPVYID